MPQLARQPYEANIAPLREAAPMGDIGGPVAAIQQSIMERLAEGGSFEIAVTRAPLSAIDRTALFVSRCAGPVALVLGYLVAAHLLLG